LFIYFDEEFRSFGFLQLSRVMSIGGVFEGGDGRVAESTSDDSGPLHQEASGHDGSGTPSATTGTQNGRQPQKDEDCSRRISELRINILINIILFFRFIFVCFFELCFFKQKIKFFCFFVC